MKCLATRRELSRQSLSEMPGPLLKSGPKLPSFQKVKSKKRKRTEEDDSAQHKQAPEAKKPKTIAPPVQNDAKQLNHKAPKQADAQSQTERKQKPKKIKKLGGKDKSKAEKKDKPKGPTPAAPRVVPGENWSKLKVCNPFHSLIVLTATSMLRNRPSSFSNLPFEQSKMQENRKPGQEPRYRWFEPNSKRVEEPKPVEEVVEPVKEEKANPLHPAGWDESSKDITSIVGIACDIDYHNKGEKMEGLRRVVVVNFFGGVILDRSVSGKGASSDKKQRPFAQVQDEVFKLLEDKLVVGHNLTNMWKTLMFDIKPLFCRDTAAYRPLQRAPNRPHKLQELGIEVLGMSAASWESHNQGDRRKGSKSGASDIDTLLRAARVPLLIYRHVQANWEAFNKEHAKVLSSLNKTQRIVKEMERLVAERTSNPISSSKKPVVAESDDSDSDSDSWASSEHSDSDHSDSDSEHSESEMDIDDSSSADYSSSQEDSDDE